MEGERERERDRERDREREREWDRDRETEALWAARGEGGVADLLVLEDRFAGSFDLEDGEEVPPPGEPLRERERLWVLAGLRERLGERDGERPRERDREREELSERERLLDLGERGRTMSHHQPTLLGMSTPVREL